MVRSTILSISLLACLNLSAQDANIDLSFNPADPGLYIGNGANSSVLCLQMQPDGKVIIGGDFTSYNGTARGFLARVNANGTLDNSFLSGTGANARVRDIALQSDGKVMIAGDFTSVNGTARNRIARLNADGSVDIGFDPGTGMNQPVYEVAVQSDGKVLAAGPFATVNGNAKSGIARLSAAGVLENAFPVVSTPFAGTINELLVQSDGKILIGGDFTTYDGTPRARLARLNSNGSLDTGLDPGTGPDAAINTMVQQGDGQLIIGGSFTQYAGTNRAHLARVTTTGALDAGFTGFPSYNQAVLAVALQADGKVLVGGQYNITADLNNYRITRLNSTGSTDATFVFEPGVSTNAVNAIALKADGRIVIAGDVLGMCTGLAGLNTNGSLDFTFNTGQGVGNWVNAIAYQTDGKAILGGSFVRYNGVLCKRIVRVNMDGSIDNTFNTGTGFNEEVQAIVVQPDGKVIVAGNFSKYNGGTRNGFVRLNTDGSVDATFVANVNSSIRTVNALALMPDGRIVAGGNFTMVDNFTRNRVVRLNADGSLDNTFDAGTGPNNSVEALVVQPDDKVIVAGQFTSIAGNASSFLGRISSTGAYDATFAVGTGANNFVGALHLMNDGKVLIGGSFSTYNGTAIRRLARIKSDGTLDNTFFPPGLALNGISALSQQPDGRILVSGLFTSIAGATRGNFARLMADGSADPSFSTIPGGSDQFFAHALRYDGRILGAGPFTSYNGAGRNGITLIRGTPRIAVKVLLAGPYNGSTMNDSLRRQGTLPLSEPYTALGYSDPVYTPGAAMNASVLTTTGNNAIVDWVLVEMRPAATPNVIAASRAVLLQRDGDVVDLDGKGTIGFAGLADGNYLVSLRHRNHLPVMLAQASAITYGTGVPVIDFTLPSTAVYDEDARINVNGTMVLAQGDITRDQSVQYTGIGNDRDPILVRLGGTNPNNVVNGYYLEDVNMDGAVKYTGANNDRDPILVTIGGTEPTVIRASPLP